MTTYINAAGVNPAVLHVWGPFYITSVFPIILHLSFGDRLSQNREVIWLSLFSLKVMENFPFHLRRQSVALSDSLIKSALYFFFIFHTQEALLPSPQPLWSQSLKCISFKSSLIVCIFCWFLFSALHFQFCVGIVVLKLAKTWSMY